MKSLRFLSPLIAVGATAILSAVSVQDASAQTSLNASGATFPAPLYGRWFTEYNKVHSDVQVNYNGVGSGQGIKDFTKGLTDFGASDAAMTDDEMAKVTNGGVLLLPMTAGSIVISYNLPGLTGAIKLPREVYPSIFDGTITKWSDPAIAKANPGVTIPDLPITVASRADGSGTTFVFSSHLAAISPEFVTKLGKGGKQVKFPGVAGPRNDGVAALIKQTPGTIGYLEYGYAKQAGLPMASLQNKAGQYVAPSPESGAATLAKVELPANLRAFITDPEGDTSYPIVTYTWWLVHTTYDKAGEADTIKALANWCLTDGQKLSVDLGYLALPPEVVTKVQAAAATIK
jgi:phosphate transport system substrate-binding protein